MKNKLHHNLTLSSFLKCIFTRRGQRTFFRWKSLSDYATSVITSILSLCRYPILVLLFSLSLKHACG